MLSIGEKEATAADVTNDWKAVVDLDAAQPQSGRAEMMGPFQAQRGLLITIPGIGPLASAADSSEIGMEAANWFPTAEQLASWTGLSPGNHQSSGKRYRGKRRKRNQHLQPTMGERARVAVRT